MDNQIHADCRKTFSTHKATLIQDTDRFLIIDWRRADGSNSHYVNYIVDKKRGSLIVGGDLGNSIATWHNPLTAEKIKRLIYNDADYYVEKLQCTSDKYYYDEEGIMADIKTYLQNHDDNELITAYNTYGCYSVENISELWNALADEISGCIDNTDGFEPSESTKDFCQALDADYWEWLYSCGKKIHTRIYLWSEGFYMACEQLGI